jgi:hypothetical protein
MTISQKELDDAFLQAVYNGHFSLAKHLLKNGANVNATDDMGKNALFYLTGPRRFTEVRMSEIVLVKFGTFLIRKGARVNKRNNYNTTPIRYANCNGIRELYIMNGADPFIKNEDGNAFSNEDFYVWFHWEFKGKKIDNYEDLQKAIKEMKK